MATVETPLSRFVPDVLGRGDYQIIGEIVEPNSKIGRAHV